MRWLIKSVTISGFAMRVQPQPELVHCQWPQVCPRCWPPHQPFRQCWVRIAIGEVLAGLAKVFESAPDVCARWPRFAAFFPLDACQTPAHREAIRLYRRRPESISVLFREALRRRERPELPILHHTPTRPSLRELDQAPE